MVKPRNKKYQQKYKKNTLSPIFGFSDDEDRRLKMLPHLAIGSLAVADAGGNDAMADWTTVLVRIVSGREMAMRHFSTEVAVLMQARISTLVDMFVRFDTTTKWDITESELTDINYALNIVDDMQSSIRRKDYHVVYLAIRGLQIAEILENQNSITAGIVPEAIQTSVAIG